MTVKSRKTATKTVKKSANSRKKEQKAEPALQLTYTAAQEAIFKTSTARRRIVRKGRRVGFTRGAAQYVIESMLNGVYKRVLWGDTIHQNVRNYVERYFIPILKQLPQELWSWRVTEKLLIISDALCDFRSADNPENWEGFAYDLVILNEAGIILRNRYLWENAVAPMLLDNPDSVAIIGGTPKGRNLFYELYMKGGVAQGEDDASHHEKTCGKGKMKSGGWEQFAFTTYDNPHIAKEAIDELIREMGSTENVIRQEIYGEFLDSTVNELFAYALVKSAMTDASDIRAPEERDKYDAWVWGIDVARHGSDQSVIAIRAGQRIQALIRKDTPDLMVYADYIAHLYAEARHRPDAIFVEINGIGAGFYDRLVALGLPALAGDVAARAAAPKVFNKRSEMYKTFAGALNRGLMLPDDRRLAAELGAIEYEISDEGVFRVLPKDQIRKKLGYSPDSADACALTFFSPVYPPGVFIGTIEFLPTGRW